MNCRTFQRRLQSLLDQRQAPEEDADLQQHAWKCERCQQLLVGQQQLWLLLADDVPPSPSSDFAARVMARLDDEASHSPTIAFHSSWKWLAVAASLLIVILPLAWQFRSPPQAAPHLVHHRPEPAQNVTDPGFTDPGLTNRSLAVAEPIGPHSLEPWQYGLKELWRDPLDSVEEITGTLRPITASFGVTINALRKTLPLPSKEGATKPQAGGVPYDVYV